MINNLSTTSQPLNLLTRKNHKIHIKFTELHNNTKWKCYYLNLYKMSAVLINIDMVSSSLNWAFNLNYLVRTQFYWKRGLYSITLKGLAQAKIIKNCDFILAS